MSEQIKRGANVAIFPPLAAVAVPTTKILAIGNVTAKGTPDAIGAVLPFEVRATVRLHLTAKSTNGSSGTRRTASSSS
jgi:hypothetical protein